MNPNKTIFYKRRYLGYINNNLSNFATSPQTFIRLVVLRHGESMYNLTKKWAGWTDVRLSETGIKQAHQTANLIKAQGLIFDEVYTSALTRTIMSANQILDELNMQYLPITKSWRLNQKHYGKLQDLNKMKAVQQYGEEIVKEWRRSLDIRPPPVQLDDPRHPRFDRRYKYIPQSQLPDSQALSDVISRMKVLWEQQLKPKLLEQKKILIVSHGSTFRALMHLLQPDKSLEEIRILNMPNGTPIIYHLNNDLKVIKCNYLGDKKQIKKKMKQIQNQTKKIDD